MSVDGSEIGRPLKNVGRGNPQTVETSPAESKSTAGNGPTWNSSTMCLRTLHRALSAQGWHDGQPDIPMHEGEAGSLPCRPLDLGVGLWR